MIPCMGQKPTAPLPLGSGLLTQNDPVLHIPDREPQMPPNCFGLAGSFKLSLKTCLLCTCVFGSLGHVRKSYQEGSLLRTRCFGEVSDQVSPTDLGKFP